jgi:hypothetical protein
MHFLFMWVLFVWPGMCPMPHDRSTTVKQTQAFLKHDDTCVYSTYVYVYVFIFLFIHTHHLLVNEYGFCKPPTVSMARLKVRSRYLEFLFLAFSFVMAYESLCQRSTASPPRPVLARGPRSILHCLALADLYSSCLAWTSVVPTGLPARRPVYRRATTGTSRRCDACHPTRTGVSSGIVECFACSCWRSACKASHKKTLSF